MSSDLLETLRALQATADARVNAYDTHRCATQLAVAAVRRRRPDLHTVSLAKPLHNRLAGPSHALLSFTLPSLVAGRRSGCRMRHYAAPWQAS